MGVSMPSVSGGGLRPPAEQVCDLTVNVKFLCPRCRAGVCDFPVSRPRQVVDLGFLCPRCRAGVCDRRWAMSSSSLLGTVSMPSVSGGGLRRQLAPSASRPLERQGFYALGVGRGFATGFLCRRASDHPRLFLCPRCRAGVCDHQLVPHGTPFKVSFYALGVGRGFATLLPVSTRRPATATVSMPSVSGGGLRLLRSKLSVTPQTRSFLCPRCRAGVCDGCLADGSLTCCFGVRSAILSGTGLFGKVFRRSPARLAVDLGICARQPMLPERRNGNAVPAPREDPQSWPAPVHDHRTDEHHSPGSCA